MKKNMKKLVILLSILSLVSANDLFTENGKEKERIDLLIDLIILNFKPNGWHNVLVIGDMPDLFYVNLNQIKPDNITFATSNVNGEDYFIEDTVPYSSNTIVINCFDFDNFEESLRKAASHPYWHPHGNIIVYYHSFETKEILAKMFFAFWHFRAPNAVIYQYNDEKNVSTISYYSPFIYDKLSIKNRYGCWTAKNIGMPVYKFDISLVCELGCHNVTITSKLRAKNLGTCIGFDSLKLPYGTKDKIMELNLFEDKGKNLNGYPFIAFATEVVPFLTIDILKNNTFVLKGRDGNIWNSLMQLMNFTIDLTSTMDVIKEPFNFEINIQQIFRVAHRKGDLFLIPIYQFDVIVVEIDYTVPLKESGVCFVSHKTGYVTGLFNSGRIQASYDVMIECIVALFGIWCIFTLYSYLDVNKLTADLVGKNLMNTIRNALLINLCRPPKRQTFRIFLAITIWSFFVLSFLTQATITSLFASYKRGRDVDTFDDVVEKGYRIEGMASPDIVLPETEEKFRIINSRLKSHNDIFYCVNKLVNDNHRFCLIDCSLGRYLQNTKINSKGEQYLHIAKDRVHGHYLNMILSKHSVLSNQLNRHMMRFCEAGLIKKWEEYKYDHFKDEGMVKPLNMEDLNGLVNMYLASVSITCVIFLLEIVFGNVLRMKMYLVVKLRKIKRTRAARQIIKVERKQNRIRLVNNCTQTTKVENH